MPTYVGSQRSKFENFYENSRILRLLAIPHTPTNRFRAKPINPFCSTCCDNPRQSARLQQERSAQNDPGSASMSALHVHTVRIVPLSLHITCSMRCNVSYCVAVATLFGGYTVYASSGQGSMPEATGVRLAESLHGTSGCRALGLGHAAGPRARVSH